MEKKQHCNLFKYSAFETHFSSYDKRILYNYMKYKWPERKQNKPALTKPKTSVQPKKEMLYRIGKEENDWCKEIQLLIRPINENCSELLQDWLCLQMEWVGRKLDDNQLLDV